MKKLERYERFCYGDELVREEKKGEYVPYDPEEGAWFFLKEKRGFVISIFEFASELTDAEVLKFNKLFFSGCVEAKTNLLIAKGSRRSNKALDRAEIAELMGFSGKTAVTKCTTLLNKFKKLDIVAMKEEIFEGKLIEKWYVNPLLCKTHYRIHVDLYELFQESLDIVMAKQTVLLGALKEALKEKYEPQTKTIDSRLAKESIAEVREAEAEERKLHREAEEKKVRESAENARAGVSDEENNRLLNNMRKWAEYIDAEYIGPTCGITRDFASKVFDAYDAYKISERTKEDRKQLELDAGHVFRLKEKRLSQEQKDD